MTLIKYLQCPICDHTSIKPLYKVKDHSISKEIFEIYICNNCGFKFTNPIPDEASIGRYYQAENYISHSDTKQGLTNWLYHRIRKITISAKLKIISNDNYHTLLDIGCGTGYFLQEAQKEGWLVEGYEPDESARKLAQEKLGNKIHSDLDNIGNKKFDVITMWHVLEHIHKLEEIFPFLNNKLNSKGKLVIAVPNIESWDANFYKEYWAALDVPRHLYHFRKEDLKNIVKKYGFKIKTIKPMYFDSFYVSIMSEGYKNEKQAHMISFIKGVITGLISNVRSIVGSKNYSSLIYIIEKDEL